MIYANLSTDTNMMDVVTIRSLTDMKWEDYGDKKARQFYSAWVDRASRLDCQLDDEHKRDILFTEMKKSEGLRLLLQPYKRLKKEERIYRDLLDVFKNWLQETKEEANLKKEMELNRHDDNSGKRKSMVSKGVEKGKSGKDAPKGKGKGKDDGKGKTKNKTSSPGTDSNKKYDTKCAYYQTLFNGGGKCTFGDRCHYIHELVSSRAEYDALYKPWEDTEKKVSPREGSMGDKGGKGGFKGKSNQSKSNSPRAFAANADWGMFCRQCMECPGLASQTCPKIHAPMEEASRIISLWKEDKKRQGQGAIGGGSKKKDSPRPHHE
jgi:hypothetical protein